MFYCRPLWSVYAYIHTTRHSYRICMYQYCYSSARSETAWKFKTGRSVSRGILNVPLTVGGVWKLTLTERAKTTTETDMETKTHARARRPESRWEPRTESEGGDHERQKTTAGGLSYDKVQSGERRSEMARER